jgi:hypothetical protein
MNIENWAAVAGIGGIGVAAATLVFRDIIAKKIFSNLPAHLTYKLLRLIVICSFVLGLIGALGYIWLQHTAQAAAKTAEGTLQAALVELNKVNSEQKLFSIPSLNTYLRSPTSDNWKVAATDLQRVWGAVEKAKNAIVNYNATTSDPISLSDMGDILLETHANNAAFIMRPQTMPPPDPFDLKEMHERYKRLASDLNRALIELKKRLD